MIPPDQVTLSVEGWNAHDLRSRDAFDRSLRSLTAQTYPVRQCHVLVMVADSASADDVESIHRVMPTASVLRVRGATYFRFKNAAMQAAKGSYLVFADSDVRYSPRWLELILEGFRPGVDLVGGNTRYERGFLSTTLSLCDWSATRTESGSSDWFYGNNLAMRRSLFDRVRFREDLGTSGGGAVNVLREELLALGVRPWICAEAQAWHHLPPFLEKRLRVGGYQIQYRRKAPHTAWSWTARTPVLAPFLVTGGTLAKASQRAWRLRSTLPGRGLSLPIYLLSIAWVKAFELVGAALVAWAPGWVSRRYGWFDVPAAASRPALGGL